MWLRPVTAQADGPVSSTFGVQPILKGSDLAKKKTKSAASEELHRIRCLWREASQGDPGATDELLATLFACGSADGFARKLGQLKVEDAKHHTPPPMTIKHKKPATPWERAKSTLSTGRVHVVGGGLPSLGKGSK